MHYEIEYMPIVPELALKTCIDILIKERDEARQLYQEIELGERLSESFHYPKYMSKPDKEVIIKELTRQMRRIKECELGINALYRVSYPALIMLQDDISNKEKK